MIVYIEITLNSGQNVSISTSSRVFALQKSHFELALHNWGPETQQDCIVSPLMQINTQLGLLTRKSGEFIGNDLSLHQYSSCLLKRGNLSLSAPDLQWKLGDDSKQMGKKKVHTGLLLTISTYSRHLSL